MISIGNIITFVGILILAIMVIIELFVVVIIPIIKRRELYGILVIIAWLFIIGGILIDGYSKLK